MCGSISYHYLNTVEPNLSTAYYCGLQNNPSLWQGSFRSYNDVDNLVGNFLNTTSVTHDGTYSNMISQITSIGIGRGIVVYSKEREHMFVITEVSSNGTVMGYDPDTGSVNMLNLGLFTVNSPDDLVLFKVNDCN